MEWQVTQDFQHKSERRGGEEATPESRQLFEGVYSTRGERSGVVAGERCGPKRLLLGSEMGLIQQSGNTEHQGSVWR